MMNVTKESVEKLLAMFGDQDELSMEHDRLMDLLGGMPEEEGEEDEYEDDEEESGGKEDYMKKLGMMGMGAHKGPEDKKQGPKMMALKIMIGKGDS